MIGDDTLLAIAAAAYTGAADYICAGDVHVCLHDLGGVVAVSYRGTVPTSWEDWFRDCAAWPARLVDHPKLGPCHSGFVYGAEASLPWLRAYLTASKPFVLTGHSLGGALAIAAAALLIDAGLTAAILTTFGAPRVGFSLEERLAPIAGKRYRNGRDPVPEVPCWPYRHDRVLSRIGLPGAADPIEDHATTAYGSAITARAPMPSEGPPA